MSELGHKPPSVEPPATRKATANPGVGPAASGGAASDQEVQADGGSGVSSSWLGTAIQTLLEDPPEDGNVSPFVSAARSTVDCTPLPTRAELWADLTFWEEEWWAQSGQSAQAWRQQVDPLSSLLAAPDLARARQVMAVPGFRERIASHPDLIATLASGETGIAAFALRAELATGESVSGDVTQVLQQWLSATAVSDATPLLNTLRGQPELAVEVAKHRDVVAVLRARFPDAATEVDALASSQLSGTASQNGDEAGDGWLAGMADPIEQIAQQVLAAAATGGDYVDPGPEVLAALLAGQQRLFALAQDEGSTSSQAAARTGLAQEALGQRLRESLVLQELLDQVEDLYAQRRIAQLLGLEADHRLRVAGSGAGLDLAEVERFGRLGAMLADAVNGQDEQAAIAISAVVRDERLTSLESAGQDTAARTEAIRRSLRAGYAPIGGDLAFGLAVFENGNLIAQRLSFDSLAIAQKSADDTRDNRVVQADWDLDTRMAQLFRDIHEGNGAAALARAGVDHQSLLLPAQVLAPDDRLGLIQRRYLDNHGIALGAHIERSQLGPQVKAQLTAALGVSLAGEVCNDSDPLPERSVLQPEFFELDGQPIAGVDMGAPEFMRVGVATDAHVAHLSRMIIDMRANPNVEIAAYDTHKYLTEYLSGLTPTGGKQLVLDAFEQTNGARLSYYLQTMRLDGQLDDRTASAADRLIDSDGLHPVSAELRGLADASQWDEVLKVANAPAFASARATVLADGETLAYLRAKAPNTHAWDLFYRSATGELRDAELINRDGGVVYDVLNNGWLPNIDPLGLIQDGMEWASGTSEDDIRAQLDGEAERSWDPDRLWSAAWTGDESERMTIETEELLKLRDSGLEGDELEQRRLERVTDADVQHRLGSRHGEGDARYLEEMKLLGREKEGKAVEAQTHWWGSVSDAHAAIVSMDDKERMAAMGNPMFLQSIDQMTAGNPVERQRLLDVLHNGKDGAWRDQLLDAEGHNLGMMADFSREPWKAVDALTKMSWEERAVLHPENRDRFRAAARPDEAALKRVEALLSSADGRTDGDGNAARDVFVAEQTAALTVALASGTDAEVATSLVALSEAVASQRDSERVALSVDGWPIGDLVGLMRPAVHEQSVARYSGMSGMETAGSVDYMQLFDKAVRGAPGLAVDVLYRTGAEDAGALIALVKAASDQTVAREWASLVLPQRDGGPSLRSVYAGYRAAREAAESKPPGSAEAVAAQQALVTLQGTRVDLAAGALSIDLLDRQGFGVGNYHEDLESLSSEAWEKGRKAVRERIGKLPAEVVHSVVGVAPEDVGVVWTPQMRMGVVTAETADQMSMSLSETSFLFEQLTSADNDAALHYAVFAQQAEQGVQTEADLSKMRELATAAQGTLGEYDAARKVAADLASFAATLMVTAVTAALTGPGAGPALASAISLGSSALSGLASIAIKESVQGSRYDAEEGLKTLVIDLAKETVSLGTSEVFSAMKTARAFSEVPLGNIPRFLHKAQTAAEGRFGEPATAIALAGLAVPWEGVKASAWAGVEEGVAGRGWSAGVDRGMLVLSGKLEALPEETVRAMLEEVASQLAESAVDDDKEAKPSTTQLTGIEVAEETEQASRKALADFIRAKLDGVSGKALDSGVKTLVESGTHLALDELMDAARTGEHSLTEEEIMGVLGSTLKAMAKTTASETGKAVGGGARAHRAQERAATARHVAGEQLGTSERVAAFVTWLSANNLPINGMEDIFEARETFNGTVWDVAEGRIEAQRPDDDSVEFSLYRQWVMSEPTKMLERASGTTYEEYNDRVKAVETDLLKQQSSAGFRDLTVNEQAWFLEAANRPWLLTDLSEANGDVAISVDTAEGRERFRESIGPAQEALDRRWVEQWAADVGGRRAEFAREHIDYVVGGLEAVPGQEVQGYQWISERVADAQRVVAMAEQAGLHAQESSSP